MTAKTLQKKINEKQVEVSDLRKQLKEKQAEAKVKRLSFTIGNYYRVKSKFSYHYVFVKSVDKDGTVKANILVPNSNMVGYGFNSTHDSIIWDERIVRQLTRSNEVSKKAVQQVLSECIKRVKKWF